jgi:hypothetical protein
MKTWWPMVRKNITADRVNAACNVIIALGVVVAVAQYLASERAARLDQTLRLLNLGPLTVERTLQDEKNHFDDMFHYFSDRYVSPFSTKMPDDEAEKLYNAASRRVDNSPSLLADKVANDELKEYFAARDELNQMATIAFAYTHRLGDRKILADAQCISMSRTANYFSELVTVFLRNGHGQDWAAIQRAVDDMKAHFPEACKGDIGPAAVPEPAPKSG